MGFLPTLLSALIFLLPVSGRGTAKPVGLDSLDVRWTGSFHDGCDQLDRPADLPLPSRLFFENLDESALEEEDSDEFEDTALLSHVLFGEVGFPAVLSNPTATHLVPRRPHAAHSILRC